MTFDDFSQVEIKNVGIELAKAREVLNKTSVDFVLDLRTTKHHINAIEEGELRILRASILFRSVKTLCVIPKFL